MSCQHTLLIHMVQQQWFCSVINTGNRNWMWHIWKLSFGVQRLKLPVAINQLVFLHICLRNITKYAEVKWNIDIRLILDNSDYYYNTRFLKIKGTAAAVHCFLSWCVGCILWFLHSDFVCSYLQAEFFSSTLSTKEQEKRLEMYRK